ncbi:MAG TPA: N-acetylmuramoyl-L-alanine amidase [Terriglobales bacterium]|nr:N-acetylmuramoyl-L-alanine amidase [Terriglobales bacterium]
MSAGLNNPDLELMKEDAAAVPAVGPRASSPTERMGHEALQALLAFSALHEQIRSRRAKQTRDGSNPDDDWQLEQFVLDEVLQLVAERALAVTGADGVAVALAQDNAIVCRASAGSIVPDPGVRLDPNSGFSGECLVSGRIVRCDDVDIDPRVNLEACRRLGVRSMLAVPLSAKQNVVGLLEAFSGEPYGFNDSDVRSLNLLAELILSAMKPEEEDRLREISRQVVKSAAAEPEMSFVFEPETVELGLEAADVHEGTVEGAASQEESLGDSNLGRASLSVQPGEDARPPQSVALTENSESISGSSPGAKPERVPNSTPGLAVVAAVVVIAVALGAMVWWKLGHRVPSARVQASSVAIAASPQSETEITQHATPEAALAAATSTENEDETESAPTTPEEAGLLPQITGIRHWSSADSSTVVVDIQDQVQYEAHRLPNPERIYFDLHDTTLAGSFTTRTIAVNDALLQRVRVAQPMAGVTRVVLETTGASDFSVRLEPNPYRLVVEVRKIGDKSHPRAKLDLFAFPDPAILDQGSKKQPPELSSNQLTLGQKQSNQALLSSIALTPSTLKPSLQVQTNDNRPATSAKPEGLEQVPTPLHGPKLRIVLDAGHGGWDLGTVGRKGLLEKDLVLDIVQRLGRLIETRLGAEVIYTRKDDSYLSLEKRAEIANLAQANLFVSIHANYSDFPSARGVETYYTNTYSSVKARTEDADDASPAGLKTIDWTNVDIREKVRESRRIAASLQHSLYAMLSENNSGLRNRGVKQAQYVVLTGTSMPAVLAEVSFVSSPTDENNLQSSTYRQRIAEALYSGIAHYQASRDVKMASGAKPAGR